MLCHLISSTCHHEASTGRDIEGVLLIAASTHDVDITVCIEKGRNTRLKYSVTEAEKLVNRNATHLQASQKRCDLCIVNLLTCDCQKYLSHFLARKQLMLKHSRQNFLHYHGLISIF